MADKHSRRDFLVKTGSLVAVGLMAPSWLAHITRRDLALAAAGKTPANSNLLVVCQLGGGNDGLNTVVPWTNDVYRKSRPSLRLSEKEVLPLDQQLALHGSLAGLKGLYDKGHLAVVNGVGYPGPDRSHFRSMRIWNTADSQATRDTGWIGRFLDTEYDNQRPNPVLAVSLGRSTPLAVFADKAAVPTFASLSDLNTLAGTAESEDALRMVQAMADSNGQQLEFVRQATGTALDSVDALTALLGNYEPTGNYGDDPFGKGFRQVAHLAAVSAATRVIYINTGGFDTHAQQKDRQAELLQQFSDAAAEFYTEMESLGRADSVCLLAFSEFGRRVAENGSAGTDHGAAGPMFVLGGRVKGGLYGQYPDLSDLENGDLRYNVDFRSVYASVLNDWMGTDASEILGAEFPELPLF